MKPTLDNLDQWLFDSVEGNLSQEQQELLAQFFAQNPELSLEQDAWEQASYTAAPITFEPKAALYRKRRINQNYYYAAAALLLLLFAGSYFFKQEGYLKSKSKAYAAKPANLKNPDQQKNTLLTSSTSTAKSSTAISSTSSSIQSSSLITLNFPNLHHTPVSRSSLSSTPSSPFPSPSTSSSENELLSLRFPKLINGYRTDLRFESLAGIQTENNGSKNYHWPALQRMSQFAQKELGLTNNQSYDLLLPGKSNIDANISSVGSQSQTRFQSVSMARTGTQKEQALLGQRISLDGYARNLKSGFGLQANYMQFAGSSITDYEIGFIAAPKLMLTRQIIVEPAARLRMGSRQVNASKLGQLSFIEFQNADLRTVNIDSTEGIGRRLFYRDLDLSVAIQTPILFASAQLENVFQHFDYVMGNELQPQNSRAPQQLTLALGTQYASRNEKMRLSPYLLFTSNRLQTQFHAGAQLNINRWQFGLNIGTNQQYQAAIGYFGRHTAILVQSCQQQLLTLNAPSFLHQLTFRIYSQNSRQARRYISL
jgi:hypothetical protein